MNLPINESLCRQTPAPTSDLERPARSSSTLSESWHCRSVSAAAARRLPRLRPGNTGCPQVPQETCNSTDLTVYRELIVMLLSFWDYLRRRTAESVLLGIQDALAEAERPSTEVAVAELVIKLEPPGEAQKQQATEPQQLELANVHPSQPVSESPRRRGRPRKHPTTP
jgi:hypothetical protein